MIEVMPWEMENVISIWNTLAAQGLGWRTYMDGKANSRPRSLRRLGIILDRADSDIETFTAELTAALIYIQDRGTEAINNKLGSQYNLRITFWTFIRDLNNVQHLSNLALNRTPDVEDQDKARRDEKAEMLQSFEAELKEWVSYMAYRAGDSNQALEDALDAARAVMATGDDAFPD